MTIAIDINDVLREYSTNFLKYYVEGYNREYEIPDDFEFWTNDMSLLFPFQSKYAYEQFTYEQYVFELYGRADLCERNLSTKLNEWKTKFLDNLDEEVNVILVSTNEYGLSIGNTLFFLSKMAPLFREYYLPKDSSTIWDRCDVLITANPLLLENKPEGKQTVKIKREYNEEANSDFEYNNLSNFLNDKEIINKFNKANNE